MNTKIIGAAFAVAVVLLPIDAMGRDGSGRSSSGSHHYSSRHYLSTSRSAVGVERDARGRIKRSRVAKSEFRSQQPCPSTGSSRGACPGYVIDHVQPLKRGGADAPSNMQWQTRAEAKAKDRWE